MQKATCLLREIEIVSINAMPNISLFILVKSEVIKLWYAIMWSNSFGLQIKYLDMNIVQFLDIIWQFLQIEKLEIDVLNTISKTA